MADRRSERLANAGRQLGKPVRKPKKKFDVEKISPERMDEINKAGKKLWGTK